MTASQPKRFRLTLGTQVVLALILGLAMGLFFRERVAFFKDIGRAFILLLQMTVLPYIVFSLIASVGRPEEGKVGRSEVISPVIILRSL